MKTIAFGNILDNKTGIIVQGCNSYGVSGAGLALQIKNRWPGSHAAYADYVSRTTKGGDHSVILGHVIYYGTTDGPVIANAITQNDMGRDPKKRYVSYSAVQKAFTAIVKHAAETGASVHYPQIGAGLANGDWAVLSEIIDTAFAPYPHINRTLWLLPD